MKTKTQHRKSNGGSSPSPLSQSRVAAYPPVEQERIPIARPWIDSKEEERVLTVLRSGWLVQGENVAQFERKMATEVGNEFGIAVSSGTTALHLALVAAKVEAGDSVMIPAFSFVATANVIEQCGAKPVFVDIDLDSFTVDPDKILKHIFSKRLMGDTRPKVIMPVSLFGHPVNVKRLSAIAREFQMGIIEDAACGLGSQTNSDEGRSEFLASCYSFHPRKVITTGEGGMITTNDDRFANSCRQLRDHGAVRDEMMSPILLPSFPQVGFNYRMTDMQGAMGVAQMEKLEEILRERSEQSRRYTILLKGIAAIRPPSTATGMTHGWQAYVCLYTGGHTDLKEILRQEPELITTLSTKRNQIMAFMEEHGASVRQGTHAIHTLEYYQKKYALRESDFPNAYLADRLSIALPLFHGMTGDQQKQVVTTFQTAVESVG
jgi:perosamine synthetase